MLSESILKKNYYKTFVLLWMLGSVSFLFIVGFHWMIYGGEFEYQFGYITSMILCMYTVLNARETAGNKRKIIDMIKYIKSSEDYTFQVGEVIDNSIKEVETL